MKNSRLLLWLLCGMFLTTSLACGDDDDDGDGDGNGADTGGNDAGNDTGGGGSDTGGGGNDTGGGTEDTGPLEECSTTCPTALPSAGNDPRVVFREVVFGDDDAVVIENLSGATIDFDGWQLCNRPSYAAMPAVELAAGGRLTVVLGQAGTNTSDTVFVENFPDLGDSDEIALYRSAQFESDDDIEAYLVWGGVPASTRIDLAVAADLWPTDGDFVELCEGAEGLRAVGNVALPTGWRALTASCF